MRIVAGKFGSRKIRTLRGQALRPTSDRLRETLFNILGPGVEGSVFVDVYAGTGAVGLEALSRGARLAVFIEEHPPAVALIRRNLESLGIREGVEILAGDALQGLELLLHPRFGDPLRADFVFLDPPYASREEYQRALDWLDTSRLLARDARVIVEHARRLELPTQFELLECIRVVTQGDSALSFYRQALAA